MAAVASGIRVCGVDPGWVRLLKLRRMIVRYAFGILERSARFSAQSCERLK
jgi:hypothetical protein